MSGPVATVIAALIGAALGSIGAVLVEGRMRRREEAGRRRDALVRRHLFLTQDAVESLWYRLKNVDTEGGGPVMEKDPGYREVTSLYALGRVLGLARVLALEGIYPEVTQTWPTLREPLMNPRLDLRVQELFRKDEVFHYHLLGLAEGALAQQPDGFRVITYTEFRQRYEDEALGLRRSLAPVLRALDSVDTKRSSDFRKSLREVALALEVATGIRTSLHDRVDRQPARSRRVTPDPPG